MFEGPGFPKSLDEEVFNLWLEKGRLSNIGHKYLLVVWDEYEAAYRPIYTAQREDIHQFDKSSSSRERLVAAYDLYSESKIS
jgi:hypothetical protein